MLSLVKTKRTLIFLIPAFLGAVVLAVVLLRTQKEAPQNTSLKITANIEGVKVALDNPASFPAPEDLHPLPLTLEDITPGEHLLYAEKEGYQEIAEKVEVVAGKMNAVEIILYPEIQVLFEKLNTGNTVENAAWLDNKTALYQTGDQIREVTLNSSKGLIDLPSGSEVVWLPRAGQAIIKSKQNQFLYTYPDAVVPDAREMVVEHDRSPDGKKTSYLEGNTLVISDLQGNILREVDLEEGVIQAAHIWLSKDEIILIEKEKEMPFLDRIYLVNLKSPKKRFLITSATLIGRLDLNFQMGVSPGGDKILLKENNGPLIFAFIERGETP